MAFGSPQWMYASGGDYYEYKIPYSCKFDNAKYPNNTSPPSLTKTYGSAGNRRTFTWSIWLKRGRTVSDSTFVYAGPSNNDAFRMQIASDVLTFYDYQGSGNYMEWKLATTAKLRDHSAWYHIVLAFDTTQGTNTNRAKVYVNGSQVTNFNSPSYPSQNYQSNCNSANRHIIGETHSFDGGFDGYYAEVHFIDGTALTPTSFGETGDYGDWKPIEYTGGHGTNGFYLDFADSGNLGDDESANTNDFAETNIAASEQMLDSPTNNFAVLNAVWKDSSVNLQEGNLRHNRTSNMNRPALSTISLGTGKWYFEALDSYTTGNQIGVEWEGADVETHVHNSGTQAYTWNSSGSTYANGSYAGGGSAGSVASGARIRMVAYDGATGKLWGGANGTWGSSGNPAAGTNESMTVPAAYRDKMHFIVATENSSTSQGIVANFGQDSSFAGIKTAQGNQDGNEIGDFYYTPPSGFLALCTSNLPAVAVTPSEHFNTVTWDGDSDTSRAITVGFQPDWVWIKGRNNTCDHRMFDVVRGASKTLRPNTAAAEANDSQMGSFDSNGFELGNDSCVNYPDRTFVAWNWKASGSTSAGSNLSGVGSCTQSVNQDTGFSIVKWTSTQGGPISYGHGLSKAPEMIISKSTGDTDYWSVGHDAMGWTKHMQLNVASGESTTSSPWNNTAPTSTIVYKGGGVNNGQTYINFHFHSVDGYSKVGSYTGNNNADGPFIYLGFRPKYFMIKASTTTDGWVIYDSLRDSDGTTGFNKGTAKMRLFADNDPAETEIGTLDFLSNGIKIRASGLAMNEAHTYIYMAFAETPFKYSNAK